MKYLVTDAAGNILRTVTANSAADGTAQLASGQSLYAVPDGAGLIDDGLLVVTAGVLKLKDPAKPAAAAGTAVTAVAA